MFASPFMTGLGMPQFGATQGVTQAAAAPTASVGFSSPYLMGASMLSSAVGAYQSAASQKSALQFQAQMADQNARLAELGAQFELMRGQKEKQRSRLKTAQLKSAQRTAMAANGIDLGEGTAVDILTTTDVMGEEDANVIEANAIRSAWGYRTQSGNARAEADVGRATARGINPYASAGASLLGGAGKVASSWYSATKDPIKEFYLYGSRGAGD